jgi:hypothetical protein
MQNSEILLELVKVKMPFGRYKGYTLANGRSKLTGNITCRHKGSGVKKNYYTLTNSFQTYYQNSLSTPYSANNYRLEARSNVSNNSTGTATILTLRVTLTDAYVPQGAAPAPSDQVDGTMTISVEELKAAGTLIPSGSFSITSPTYSLSVITAS